MKSVKMTPKLAHAVAVDAANASARKGNRKVWDRTDREAFMKASNKAWELIK